MAKSRGEVQMAAVAASKFHFEILTTSTGGARRGRVHTTRGTFETPVFMPVGTRGTIKAALVGQIAEIGFEVILGNTYHLMLRPGAEVVASFGSLHGFTGWKRHMLTDSGGFQVMSLGAEYSEQGARFRSIYDGSVHTVTPEEAVTLQELIGADIQMVLDVCTMLPAPRDRVERALELTHQWAKRARSSKSRPDQAQFGIVQGGGELDLRALSAKFIADLDFEGHAIGGLAVGESRGEMLAAIEASVEHLPEGKVRYLMGVGDPVGMLEAIARGVDMFDCVAPSRIARHGQAMTFAGKLHMKNLRYQRDERPIEDGCPCAACAGYPRGLVRHLLNVGEPTAGMLLTLHNLTFMHRLVQRARTAIVDGTLGAVIAEVRSAWDAGPD
ncbi:MAG: tRNA guanosine(34) transglycosylase Tgt [Nitrospiraceae bacterium]|nr:tRNA guanosine(34) transglycosylase Tgt [Nitrospiraceae bacterium]